MGSGSIFAGRNSGNSRFPCLVCEDLFPRKFWPAIVSLLSVQDGEPRWLCVGAGSDYCGNYRRHSFYFVGRNGTGAVFSYAGKMIDASGDMAIDGRFNDKITEWRIAPLDEALIDTYQNPQPDPVVVLQAVRDKFPDFLDDDLVRCINIKIEISGHGSEPLNEIARKIANVLANYKVEVEERGEPKPCHDGLCSDETVQIIIKHE